MEKYSKVELNETNYQKVKTIQFYNQGVIKEHHIGSRKKLYLQTKLLATTSQTNELPLGQLSNQQFTSFLGRFNKTLYSQFEKNPDLINLSVKHQGFARKKNIHIWASIENESKFYNLDLYSAYWQIAYKLGYISEKLFLDYFENDMYKQAKRYAISFLARKNEMHYLMSDQTLIIKCDTSILKKVYDNIRFELYNCLRYAIDGINEYLEYNIDGVYVKYENLKHVLNRFSELGLKCRIMECTKINDFQYKMKGIIRNFKK